MTVTESEVQLIKDLIHVLSEQGDEAKKKLVAARSPHTDPPSSDAGMDDSRARRLAARVEGYREAAQMLQTMAAGVGYADYSCVGGVCKVPVNRFLERMVRLYELCLEKPAADEMDPERMHGRLGAYREAIDLLSKARGQIR